MNEKSNNYFLNKCYAFSRKSLATILFFGTLLLANTAEGQVQDLPKLTITFSDLSTSSGNILILVKNELDKDVAKLVLPINDKFSEASFSVKPGKYAVVAFHDINGNEELDKNMLGIPTEPYGFSNNARGMLGPPDLSEQLVDVTRSRMITFKLE